MSNSRLPRIRDKRDYCVKNRPEYLCHTEKNFVKFNVNEGEMTFEIWK